MTEFLAAYTAAQAVIGRLVTIGLGVALVVSIVLRVSPRAHFTARLWWHESGAWLTWKAAYLVPRAVALLVFVRVYSTRHDAPGPEYIDAYKRWEAGEGT